jgi:hypothetical protein
MPLCSNMPRVLGERRHQGDGRRGTAASPATDSAGVAWLL